MSRLNPTLASLRARSPASAPEDTAEERATRRKARPPDPGVEQILAWADAYFARHGAWPNKRSGAIPEAPEVTWMSVDVALRLGYRGLPGDSSLRRPIELQVREREHE